MGLMLVIFSPEEDLTNSLLIKRPIGCLYSRPLGALRSTNKSDMLKIRKVECCRAVIEKVHKLKVMDKARVGRCGNAPQRGLGFHNDNGDWAS